MANNYTPSYNQYLTQTAGYVLPSSVRSYSVFDPSSNSWKRMTNDGRSPMPMTPAQEQAAVAGALMQAQQTQGKVWNPLPAPVQGMTPTQTPGILLRSKQQQQQQPARQVIRPLSRSNVRVNTKPKISDYNNDDVILRVADIPTEVTLGTQPTVRVAPVNMSPDYQTPTPYVSNETAGLAGYNPNIAYTQNQLALGRHYRQTIPARPLTVAEHLSLLLKKREAQDALRAATGLPPLE